MTTIVTKRAYEPPSSNDGIRILVDRLWPRGLRKDEAALDLWAKDLAPTPALRKWFDHRPERFAEFKRRYRGEFEGNPAVADVVRKIGKAKATLLYAAKDQAINHAVVLAEFLSTARPEKRPPDDRKLRREAKDMANSTVDMDVLDFASPGNARQTAQGRDRVYFFSIASRCLISLSSSSVCCAIRSAFRSSSSAPENAAACSISCRMFSRTMAMCCSSSGRESELLLLIILSPGQFSTVGTGRTTSITPAATVQAFGRTQFTIRVGRLVVAGRSLFQPEMPLAVLGAFRAGASKPSPSLRPLAFMPLSARRCCRGRTPGAR